jgi:hypothetical protein
MIMTRNAVYGSLLPLRPGEDHLLVEHRRWAGRWAPRSQHLPMPIAGVDLQLDLAVDALVGLAVHAVTARRCRRRVCRRRPPWHSRGGLGSPVGGPGIADLALRLERGGDGRV